MIKANRIRYLHDVDSNLELIFCEKSKISYPLHNHISVFTVGIVLDGSIILNTNQVTQIYSKNQTFIIPPYVPHSIKAMNTYSLLTLCIHKSLLDYSEINKDKITVDITNLLAGALDSDNKEKKLLLQLLSCIYSFKKSYSASFADINDPYIDGFKRQLELFPESKISIEEMAQAALISKYYFIRRFKQIVGLTPHQFQIQNRIRKAQRLIGKADTITEVALTTGFCDQSHFIKQFERLVGLTPLTYKLSACICKSDTQS